MQIHFRCWAWAVLRKWPLKCTEEIWFSRDLLQDVVFNLYIEFHQVFSTLFLNILGPEVYNYLVHIHNLFEVKIISKNINNSTVVLMPILTSFVPIVTIYFILIFFYLNHIRHSVLMMERLLLWYRQGNPCIFLVHW